jgi:hypothetical protein
MMQLRSVDCNGTDSGAAAAAPAPRAMGRSWCKSVVAATEEKKRRQRPGRRRPAGQEQCRAGQGPSSVLGSCVDGQGCYCLAPRLYTTAVH